MITGVIFYGIRLYMQEIDNKARTANSTGLVLLSTRNIGSYQSVQDMMKSDSKSPWGNHISFLHVPIPKLSQASSSNPLEFVWKAQKFIKRKRNSFTVFLIEWVLDMELKLRGHEVGLYSILWVINDTRQLAESHFNLFTFGVCTTWMSKNESFVWSCTAAQLHLVILAFYHNK